MTDRQGEGSNQATTLTDLPPELLDHIAEYLPTAHSLSSLAATSKSLNAFVEKDAWSTFNRTRFPSLAPPQTSKCGKSVARTLTTTSRAWDRRAFISRYIEPFGDIRAFPGNQKIERWKRPRGQTIGFTPQLDCFEEVGSTWYNRKEVLAFSAGSEICVRRRGSNWPSDGDTGGNLHSSWTIHKPPDAVEGRDDVTSLHLLRPQEETNGSDGLRLIAGTANGDLRLVQLSKDAADEVVRADFNTQGLPIRSSSALQHSDHQRLLAASLDDTRICLYPIDKVESNVEPISTIELQRPTNGHRTYRAWSTSFLSSHHLAVGLGPSEEPIHIHALTESGLHKDPLRKFSLQNDLDKLEGEITLCGFAKKSTSSVYPIVPLPPSSSSFAGGDGNVFLSGAYDGVIRLHDLRSNRHVEKAYIDPTDESAIYSLLPRGQEKLLVGTSRHALFKVFDLRLGAKAYSYLDATSRPDTDRNDPQLKPTSDAADIAKDWNLFLKPTTGAYPGRGGGNNWARRSAESSIYSLTSPSPASPHIYAGVENAVVEMAMTSVMDSHPDPAFFARDKGQKGVVRGWRDKEIASLAMYDQESGLQLRTQRDVGEMVWQAAERTRNVGDRGPRGRSDGLDERWMVEASMNFTDRPRR